MDIRWTPSVRLGCKQAANRVHASVRRFFLPFWSASVRDFPALEFPPIPFLVFRSYRVESEVHRTRNSSGLCKMRTTRAARHTDDPVRICGIQFHESGMRVSIVRVTNLPVCEYSPITSSPDAAHRHPSAPFVIIPPITCGVRTSISPGGFLRTTEGEKHQYVMASALADLFVRVERERAELSNTRTETKKKKRRTHVLVYPDRIRSWWPGVSHKGLRALKKGSGVDSYRQPEWERSGIPYPGFPVALMH